MKQRLLSLLLALALLLALLPGLADPIRAEDEYTGSCGDDLTWRFDPDTGVLTIEGEGDMWDFWGDRGDTIPGNDAPWGGFYKQITALSLPEGLRSVGDCAFANCSGLTELTLPETLTQIGWWGFGGCTGLSAVTLPESLTFLEDYAFVRCSSLTKITFLSVTCKITDGCLPYSENTVIYGYTPSSAELYAEEQAYPFVSLGKVSPTGACGDDLTWRFDPDTGVLTIEGEGDMWDFWGYKGDGFVSANSEPWNSFRHLITGLSLPDGLSSIGDVAFSGCWRLEAVEIPAGVSRIGEFAFGACGSLRSVTIPDTVRSIRPNAFSFCTSLTEAVIPAGVASVGESAFSACDALETITFLNPDCLLGEDCVVDNGIITVYGYADSTAERYAEAQGLPFISLGTAVHGGKCGDSLTWSFDPETGVLTIEGEGAMYDYNDQYSDISASCAPWLPLMRRITAISLSDRMTYIGDSAFLGCTGLRSVAIPESVVTIGVNAFSECPALCSVVFQEGLDEIGAWSFSGCTGLQSVRFPESLQTIGSFAFGDCSSLTEVEIPAGVLSIGDSPFARCASLNSITVAADNPAYSSENGVLFDKDKTTLIQYPAGRAGAYTVPDGVRAISFNAFWTVEGLTAVYLPDGLEEIGWYAFAQSPNLTKVLIPASVNVIEDMAFVCCTSLTIYGYAGSTAEACAEYENIPFVPLDPGSGFADVNPSAYYYEAMLWALENGVTAGSSPVSFAPRNTCTREQIVTFLWKALGAPEPEASESPFSDVKPGKYYFKPVLWAVENGVTGGVGDGKFGVGRPCTREQAVSFLWKALGAPEPEGTESPFTDVKPGKYYYKPVLWAAENGVTGGVGDGKFGVGSSCTRAQIVTFLYKAFQN